MTRRTRRIISLAIGAAVATVLVWLPTAAQAGIILNALD